MKLFQDHVVTKENHHQSHHICGLRALRTMQNTKMTLPGRAIAKNVEAISGYSMKKEESPLFFANWLLPDGLGGRSGRSSNAAGLCLANDFWLLDNSRGLAQSVCDSSRQ